MSVLDTVKRVLGPRGETSTYRCADCSEEFETDARPRSYWFQCPECGCHEGETIET